MSIILDHQLREKMAHDASAFPISYFQDELALLPNQAGPLHWHPEFEIATAASGVLEYQVGQERITLEPGDSILVGGNMLHSIRQLSGDTPDPMPQHRVLRLTDRTGDQHHLCPVYPAHHR